jgi:hypothetical protein
MKYYQRKPKGILAVQFIEEEINYLLDKGLIQMGANGNPFVLTPIGPEPIYPGDWIIYEGGELYIYPNDRFISEYQLK